MRRHQTKKCLETRNWQFSDGQPKLFDRKDIGLNAQKLKLFVFKFFIMLFLASGVVARGAGSKLFTQNFWLLENLVVKNAKSVDKNPK